jgi:tryptophan synthase alpha chain
MSSGSVRSARIQQTGLAAFFAEARKQERVPLVGYLPAGYPDMNGFTRILQSLGRAGLRVMEIGVPDENPYLDGDIIRNAMSEVVRSGVDPMTAVERSAAAARDAGILPVAMLYRHTLEKIGPGQCIKGCAAAGIVGILVPDLPAPERRRLDSMCRSAGLETVGFLPANCTEPEEISALLEDTTGFVYLQAYAGSTGHAAEFSAGLEERIRLVKNQARSYGLSVALGFGIQTGQDARNARRSGADAVITGTALVRAAMDGPDEAARFILRFAAHLG